MEEFAEEFAESCIEAGYIVAGELDQWVAEQQTKKDQLLGEQKIIEITPNREADREKIILAGHESIIKATLPLVLSTHQQIENRDIGQWAGELLRENLRTAPRRLELKILLYSEASPPFSPVGKFVQRVQITIPEIKRSALDWNRIKSAVGGINGYMWGRFKTITKLIDDQGNFGGLLKVYGASADESQDITYKLLQLTDYDLATQDTTEELKTGRRAAGRAMAKEAIRVYPAYMILTNAQKVINEEEGRATLSGAYKYKSDRLELWTKTKPINFDQTIRELLTTQGADI